MIFEHERENLKIKKVSWDSRQLQKRVSLTRIFHSLKLRPCVGHSTLFLPSSSDGAPRETPKTITSSRGSVGGPLLDRKNRSFLKRGNVLNLYTVNTTRLLGGVIFNSLPLWKKEWQYTTSSRDELAICTPWPSRLPQGAYFPIHSSSRQCIITTLPQMSVGAPREWQKWSLSQDGQLGAQWPGPTTLCRHWHKYCAGHRSTPSYEQ